MKEKDITVRPWKDYELIDSGENRKLERYGEFVLIRPETQALWAPARPNEWRRANAEFVWADGKGAWRKKFIKEPWEFSWEEMKCILRLTSFKHTGVFPEQAVNWTWIKERVEALGGSPKVLNLFGYTGAASIVAAQSGASVTHLDASKQSNVWAKENATLSEVAPDNIRYILDDAIKFVEREARRGAEYDGIILDPPAFGRGPNNEVWRIEEDLPKLLVGLTKIFSKKQKSFFLLNGYAAGYAPQSFVQAVDSAFPKANAEFGELRIQESNSDRCVPSGIYARFVR